MAFRSAAARRRGSQWITTAVWATGLVFLACQLPDPGHSVLLTLDAAELTVAQRDSGAIGFSVERTGPERDLTFETSGLPDGVSAVITALSSARGGQQYALTVSASPVAAPGAHPVTLAVTGDHIVADSQQFLLTITVTGTYSLSADPAATAVTQGAQATSVIRVVRTGGFAQGVSLSASGMPAGVGVAFAPAVASGDSSVATITADAAAATGNATITITGETPGLPDQTTSIALTVNPSPPPTTPLSIDFCSGASAPVWVAYQNEGGPWTQLVPDANGTVAFDATPRFGFAFTTSRGFMGRVAMLTTVWYRSTSEAQAINGVACPGEDLTHTLAGTVAGVVFGQRAQIVARQPFALVSNTNLAYSIPAVPGGPVDLVAVRAPTFSGVGADWSSDRVVIRREMDGASGTVPLIDFESGEAATMQDNAYSITGAADGETNSAVVQFTTKASGPGQFTTLRVWNWNHSGLPLTGAFASVPASASVPGDLHDFTVRASRSFTGGSSWRYVTDVFRIPTDRTLDLGPPAATPTFTELGTAPAVIYRAEAAVQPEYADLMAFACSQTLGNAFAIEMSSAWLGAVPVNWSITVPDFTGVTGWDNAWALKPGVSTALEVNASSVSSLPWGLRRLIPDGTTARFAGSRVIGVLP